MHKDYWVFSLLSYVQGVQCEYVELGNKAIAFMSLTLSASEQNYSQIEKEALY